MGLKILHNVMNPLSSPSNGMVRNRCARSEPIEISSLFPRSPTELQFASPPVDSTSPIRSNVPRHSLRPGLQLLRECSDAFQQHLSDPSGAANVQVILIPVKQSIVRIKRRARQCTTQNRKRVTGSNIHMPFQYGLRDFPVVSLALDHGSPLGSAIIKIPRGRQ